MRLLRASNRDVYCRVDVLFTTSPAAMLAWAKKAGDPVYDTNGDLIPYEHRSKPCPPVN